MSSRILTILCLLLILPTHSFATQKPVRWIFEMHGGLFEPELSDWEQHYDSSRFPELGFSYGYRFFSVIDLGFSINYGKDKGRGILSSNSEATGEVNHQILPVELFAILRGKLMENQWLVPYIGVGYTRFAYRQDIVDQERIQGSANGQHMRFGVQLLLDTFDQRSAALMYQRWGVNNSYLYFDVKETTAEINDIPLGGRSYKVGLLFEL